ncbi:MAG: hypothetical protein H6644_15275 [Caldilineaceae bacterium]|nr:hypothetical protein [Caldilineaceae bacterium]
MHDYYSWLYYWMPSPSGILKRAMAYHAHPAGLADGRACESAAEEEVEAAIETPVTASAQREVTGYTVDSQRRRHRQYHHLLWTQSIDDPLSGGDTAASARKKVLVASPG